MKTVDLRHTGSLRNGNQVQVPSFEQYRLLFEKAADVIYMVDADFRMIYVSQSVEKHLGYSPDELSGKPFTELGLLTNDSLCKAVADTVRIINGELLEAGEYELVARDGAVKIAEVRSTPIYQDGKVISIVSVARDITAHKKTEQALRASEERFRTMAERINDGLIIVEAGKIVYVNDRACELCGYPREELVTLWGPDIAAPRSLPDREQILQKTRESGRYPEQIDTWITRKDGTLCCLNLRFSFPYSTERKQTGYVLIADITEHKRADEEIRKTKHFLDDIIDNSIDAIIIADVDGLFQRVNKSFLLMTNYAEEEVIGKQMADFSIVTGKEYVSTTGECVTADENHMNYMRRMTDKLIREKQVANWESYLVRKDGKAVPIDMTMTRLFDEQGAATGTVGIVRNSTDRKKIEKEITETRDFLDNIIESSIDAMTVTDTRGYITRVNRSFTELIGYDQKEIIGKHSADFVPPTPGTYPSNAGGEITINDDFFENARFVIARLIEEGYIASWETFYFSKTGKVIPVEQTIFYLYDKKGNRVGVVGIIRDISQRKRAEEQLIETTSFLENIIKTSADGIVVTDDTTTITMVNESAERILGYSKEELLGKTSRVFMSAIDLDKRDAIIQEMLSSGKNLYAYDQKWMRKDGVTVDLSLSIAVLRNVLGEISGYVACIRDNTEAKRAENTIRETAYFLDSVIENSVDAIVITDSKGFITRINKSLSDMTGYRLEDVCGKRMHEVFAVSKGSYKASTGEIVEIDAAYEDDARTKMSQFIIEKKLEHWESYILHRYGDIIPVEISIINLYDKQGINTGTFSILRNATERRSSEKEIAETRDFLNNIIDSSLDPIVIGDKLGNIIRVNSAFVALVGFDLDDLIGKHLAELVPPRAGLYESTDGTIVNVDESFYDRSFEQMHLLIEKGHLSAWESSYFCKDGRIVPVEQTMFYLYDKKGDRIGVVAINRDISQRKKDEQTILAARNFLGDIIRTSAEGIVVTDTLGTITLVNDAVERILGYTRDEMTGKNTHYFMWTPDGAKQDEFAVTESHNRDPVYYYENNWIRKDGQIIDVGMSMGTMKDMENNVTGMVSCIRDITKQKASEKKLHEYQNQLRCLASQLTLTEEQERKHIATEIHDQISQSLALAKIKLGAMEAAKNSRDRVKETTAIRGLLDQCIRDTRSLIFNLSPPFLYEFGLEKALEWLLDDIEKQYGIKTRLSIDTAGSGFDDDVRILLYQSIRELLINVVKHAKATSATVSLDKRGQMVHVCVQDDGCGFVMSPGGFKMSSGGGFGIFSIQERFEYLGGSLTIKSQVNQGTRIAMKLPLVQHMA